MLYSINAKKSFFCLVVKINNIKYNVSARGIRIMVKHLKNIINSAPFIRRATNIAGTRERNRK